MTIVIELIKGLHQRKFDESFLIQALIRHAECELEDIRDEISDNECSEEEMEELLGFVSTLSWKD